MIFLEFNDFKIFDHWEFELQIIYRKKKQSLKKSYIKKGCLTSCSPHTNNQYESWILARKFCLFTFWVNIYKTKVLNKGQSTSKNLKRLCYTLNWWHWFSCFIKLVVRMNWTRFCSWFWSHFWCSFQFKVQSLTPHWIRWIAHVFLDLLILLKNCIFSFK